MPELPCFQKTKIKENALFAFELDIHGCCQVCSSLSTAIPLPIFEKENKFNKLLISPSGKCGRVLHPDKSPSRSLLRKTENRSRGIGLSYSAEKKCRLVETGKSAPFHK